MDKDVLLALFTVGCLIAVLIIEKRSKYKMNIRRSIGALLTIMGLGSLFITGYPSLSEQTAGVIILISGLLLWLIKPPLKKKMNYICEVCNKKYSTFKEAEKCENSHKKK